MRFLVWMFCLFYSFTSYSCAFRYSEFTAIITSIELIDERSCLIRVNNFYNFQADKSCPLLKSEIDLRGITIEGHNCQQLRKGQALYINAEANLNAVTMM